MYLLNNNGANNPGLGDGMIGGAAGSGIFGGYTNGQPLAQQTPQDGPVRKQIPDSRTPIQINDCPQTCRDEVTEETWYLTDTNCPDCIPVNSITETTIECDNPAQTPPQRKIDCNDVVSSLRARGMNIDFAGGSAMASAAPAQGVFGLNDSFNLSGCGCGMNDLNGLSQDDVRNDDPYKKDDGNTPSDVPGGATKKSGFTAAGFLGLPNWLLLMSAGSLITYLGIKYFGNSK